MEALCFKRDMKQLNSNPSLTLWYSCFVALISYFVFSLIFCFFIHPTSFGLMMFKFAFSLLGALIVFTFIDKRFKRIPQLSPSDTIIISDNKLQYTTHSNTASNLTNIEIPFSELTNIYLFTDCISPIPYAITLKTNSQTLYISQFQNMQQLAQHLTLSMPPHCKVTTQNTFLPALHIPALRLLDICLLLLDLLLTFIMPSYYIAITVLPLGLGILHLVQAIFAQQKTHIWHITRFLTSLLLMLLGLLPILIGIAVNSYFLY